ncbi:HlyD family type I secretion periplasmic adaptor subunit [Aureimonas jatrophae]|uniref:Membrane fusion protein (MFP) family protein n=1 Tax=Aureimonas jatrophae TaxID=1166073 RepID=A0A1H0CZ51_9HYPH|nr:HlyD family type I secretion periplasmic adaptor subunit [Aureimonas jatrophae]MBB3949421.1 HlyD family type I secretion membrane fusion protein [Aureimonas jatrophae]SDN63174.1 HlyD family secretion protein/membrane fusion protein, epimerase transport system [Aureimonas jatrophae]
MSVIAFRKTPKSPTPGDADTTAALPPPGAAKPEGGDFDMGLRKPILLGSGIVAVFIVGLGIWAAFAPLSGAVLATGVVKVEDSRKVVKNRDGGIVAQVLVRDGQHVDQGDILLRMDDVQARSAYEVYDNQYMNLLARRARFTAESKGLDQISFPAEVTERRDDPSIEQLMLDQTILFDTRRQSLDTQVEILQQRVSQLNTRISGYEVQIASINRQQELIEEEKEGVASLLKKGLAPKTQVLALERASVDLGGQTGSLKAQIAEARETQGEAQMQINRLRQDRLSEANQGISDVQSEMANIVPRLQSARATLALTEVRAPATGTVLGLTQFTNGGVVGAGERILDIVPDDTQLIVQAMIKPEDIAKIEPNMVANVKLTAYNQHVTPAAEGKILRVSPDRLTTENGTAYFTADVEVSPTSLAHMAGDVRLYPGMPAEIVVPTGSRTALDYILSPISQSMDRAFREE